MVCGFWRCKSYVDIRRGSLLRWCQMRVQSSKIRVFSFAISSVWSSPTGFTYQNLHGFARFPGNSMALVDESVQLVVFSYPLAHSFCLPFFFFYQSGQTFLAETKTVCHGCAIWRSATAHSHQSNAKLHHDLWSKLGMLDQKMICWFFQCVKTQFFVLFIGGIVWNAFWLVKRTTLVHFTVSKTGIYLFW